MKKIVGIIAAAAIAASVFGAEVSAATKIKGNVFSYDGASKTSALFDENNDSHDYANPNITFSISGDNAGATVKLSTDGGTKDVAMTTQTIWFKPVDALKITVGNFDVALNKEQIDWTQSVTGLGGNGFLFSLDLSGFALDFGLSQANGAAWFSKASGATANMSAFFIKAGYGADFGNIAAYVEFNRQGANRKTYAWHDALFGYAVTKTGAISDIHFGAGYQNNFNGINLFVNVAGFMADKFEWIRPELFISGSADAFSYAAFVAPVIFTNSDLDAQLEVSTKLSYNFGAITPYIYFKDENILADGDFVSETKIGVTGNVGAMGWNLWAQINTGANTNFAIPFELTMSF